MDRQSLSRVKSALRVSTGEGVAFGAFIGLGDHYIMAFAVAAGTGSLMIGLLASVPGILASLAQLADDRLVRLLRSRRAVILVFAPAQAAMFLPLIALALGEFQGNSWWLLFSASLYSIFGALISPARGSLMAEVVPEGLRGKYFAMRGQLSTLAMVLSFLLAGVFLNQLARRDLWAFGVLFAVAMAARLLSSALLRRLYEMPAAEVQRHQARASHFLRDLPSTNLGRALVFLFAMSFSVNIASPYFPVFQLRDLKMSFLTFAALETVSSLAMLLAITHWGSAADRVGNRKMLGLAGWSISLVPLLWLASQNTGYLGAVQLFSGLAWAGFNLCSVNYLFDSTTPQNRTRYLAYFNAGNGLAAGAGALLGALLSSHVPGVLGYPVLTLFLISGCMRLLTCSIFFPAIREVRKVSAVPAAELFHILMGGRPVARRVSHRRHAHIHHHEGPATERKPESQAQPEMAPLEASPASAQRGPEPSPARGQA